ncbi:Uncharacterised protein [Serratia fonticola]|uniref:hypothetical protein n=1 Tax=Serratia TaxID=613 RepID=UPI0020062696|nr:MULTISPECIES: hypothetical protein [Serratia]CAI1069031.1 Uncharacterised protein [Serratia fonticola]
MSKLKITLEDAKEELRDAATGPDSQNWRYSPAVKALLNSHDELLVVLGEMKHRAESAEQRLQHPIIPAQSSNEVNDAAWKLHDMLTEHGPLNGHQFNNLKGCFYEALKVCMGPNLTLRPALVDVVAERQRQISAEGWTPEHDDGHASGSIAHAAGCYALNGHDEFCEPGYAPEYWPWDFSDWKPTSYRRNLVKAGALILAEIERLDRAAPKGE